MNGWEIIWSTKESEAVQGPVIVLNVSAAHIASDPGSGTPDFDLAESPENEILRVMNETWPDQIVFLPLDDPLFSNGRVPINSAGEIFVSAPKRHYGAFILLPAAQRDFVGD